MIVLDTNVLVYAVIEDDPHHAASRSLVEAVAKGLVVACVFPQNLLEFYEVVTNPRRIAKPLTSTQGLAEIAALRAILRVVVPTETSLDHLSRLIGSAGSTGATGMAWKTGTTGTIGTTGADVFDAYIVAQMHDAGIETLCTYNGSDFSGFPVRVVTPEEVLDRLGSPSSFSTRGYRSREDSI